ncbi:MAG: tetratricopeptide repeat protein [Prevotellaceae bacterium]|nr:tetratricopeptide repeat protein [Prevotellaceae bacterium]
MSGICMYSQSLNHIKGKWDSCFSRNIENVNNSYSYKGKRKAFATALNDSSTLIGIGNVFLQLSDALIQNGEYTAAMQLVQELKQDVTKTSKKDTATKIFISECDNRIGLCFSRLGASSNAMTYFNSSRKNIKGISCPKLESKIINNISEICYRQGNISTSIELQKQALDIIIKNHDSIEISAYYNNLGILYLKNRNYAEAKHNLKKAISYHKANDYNYLSYIYTNLAEVSEAENNYNEAERILQEALAMQNGRPMNESMLSTKIEMANVYVKTKRRADFLKLKNVIINELAPIRSSEFRANGYNRLSELCFLSGDSIEGARLLLKSNRINDSLRMVTDNYQLQQLLVAYDTERLQNNNTMLKQSLSQSQLQTKNLNLTIIACFFFMILLGVIVTLLIRKNRSNKIIHEQQIRIHEYEQEELKRNEINLLNTIDGNNRRLTEYAIDLSAINEFQQQLCKQLENVQKSEENLGEESQKMLANIISDLKHTKNNQLGSDFHTYFEQVNPSFIRTLKSVYPNLTANDIRLCAYLYLGLSTKEIASLTYREIRSIETSRLRLRKKLNVPQNITLQDFLNSISI